LSMKLICPLKTLDKILLSLMLLFLVGCSKTGNEGIDTESDSQLITVDFVEMSDSEKTVALSDIAQDISYVKLETNENVLINNTNKIKLTKNFIFISDFSNLYQFSKTGEFIRKIGNKGRGPGEYIHISSLEINEKQDKIYVYCSTRKKLFVYNFKGEFCRQFNLPQINELTFVRDSLFLAHANVHVGNEEYIFYLINPSSDTIPVVENHFNWEHKSDYLMSIFGDNSPYYRFQQNLYFKDTYNDTIYKFDNDSLSHTPVYYINLGKYDMPDKKRLSYTVDASKFKKYCDDYYQINVKESNDYLWIQYYTYNYFTQSEPAYGLYNKNQKKCFTIVDSKGEKSCIVNDFTAGEDFWPVLIQENTMIDYIQPFEIKESLRDNVENDSLVKLPGRRDTLRKIVSQSNKNDNPIIRIVTLK
ncbi:MAG: 6-bladed beta-propeller, partial [Bacteroidales bacterium]